MVKRADEIEFLKSFYHGGIGNVQYETVKECMLTVNLCLIPVATMGFNFTYIFCLRFPKYKYFRVFATLFEHRAGDDE